MFRLHVGRVVGEVISKYVKDGVMEGLRLQGADTSTGKLGLGWEWAPAPLEVGIHA